MIVWKKSADSILGVRYCNQVTIVSANRHIGPSKKKRTGLFRISLQRKERKNKKKKMLPHKKEEKKSDYKRRDHDEN